MPKVENLIEIALTRFIKDRSKENYVRLLSALRINDVLGVATVPESDELPFGNGGRVIERRFKPAIFDDKATGNRYMPIFTDDSKITDACKSGSARFLHCSEWIGMYRLNPCDGVVLNPFSAEAFILTADQIKVLSLFPDEGNFSFYHKR